MQARCGLPQFSTTARGLTLTDTEILGWARNCPGTRLRCARAADSGRRYQGSQTMFDPTTLVGFHTWLSLVAMASGIYLVAGLLRGRVVRGWTAFYLVTAVATSVTGFGLPASAF